MQPLPPWAIAVITVLAAIIALSIAAAIVYLIIKCATQSAEFDEEEDKDGYEDSVTETIDIAVERDFEFQGQEKIVKDGLVLDGNVTWSVRDDESKHIKERIQIVEEHTSYRVIAIATTIGVICTIIAIVAIISICIYAYVNRSQKCDPAKNNKKIHPNIVNELSPTDEPYDTPNEPMKFDPAPKKNHRHVQAEVHHPQSYVPDLSKPSVSQSVYLTAKQRPKRSGPAHSEIKVHNEPSPKMPATSLDNLTILMDLGFPARISMSALKLYPNVEAAANFLMERKKIHKLDEQNDEESDSQSDVDKSSDESGKNP